MASVFLSPSAQEFNPYVDGGNEEYYMNVITDAIEPYLTASGISFGRNDPDKSFTDAVRLSNAGQYGLHLALHSNAALPAQAGRVRGSQVYYFPDSAESKRAADIFVSQLKKIYPLPDLVKSVPTTTLGEVIRTKAPAVLIEVAYHDNPEDAEWIRDNIDTIARYMALGTGEFLGTAIQTPDNTPTGIVTTQGGRLNLRMQPTVNSDIRAKIPNGTALPLLEKVNGWYLTQYNGARGYVSGEYIRT